jgi:hypothetical protein
VCIAMDTLSGHGRSQVFRYRQTSGRGHSQVEANTVNSCVDLSIPSPCLPAALTSIEIIDIFALYQNTP